MAQSPGAPCDRAPSPDAESALVDSITSSAKYRLVCRPTIEDIVRRELAGGKAVAHAERAARLKLHRILAAYHGGTRAKREWRRLEGAVTSDDEQSVREACRALMGLHATSAQRLAHIDNGYYQRIFAETGHPAVVFDLACAFHPFAFRWMDLPRTTVRYWAYDLNRYFVNMAARYLALEGISGGAVWGDILCVPPAGRADVAFFLQTWHCVEARRPGAAATILDATPARHVVISLPTENLGGRRMHYAATYGEAIGAQAAARGWHARVLEWPGESVWIIRKPGIAGTDDRPTATLANA